MIKRLDGWLTGWKVDKLIRRRGCYQQVNQSTCQHVNIYLPTRIHIEVTYSYQQYAFKFHDQAAEDSILFFFIATVFFCIVAGAAYQFNKSHIDIHHPAFTHLPGQQWV